MEKLKATLKSLQSVFEKDYFNNLDLKLYLQSERAPKIWLHGIKICQPE